MDNQLFEKDLLAFLNQFDNLFQNKMYADALTLTEQRLQRLPMDADAYAAAGGVLMAMNRMDQVRNLLGDLEKTISALSRIHDRLGKLYTKKICERDAFSQDHLIITLSEWLENIHRIKTHAANTK